MNKLSKFNNSNTQIEINTPIIKEMAITSICIVPATIVNKNRIVMKMMIKSKEISKKNMKRLTASMSMKKNKIKSIKINKLESLVKLHLNPNQPNRNHLFFMMFILLIIF